MTTCSTIQHTIETILKEVSPMMWLIVDGKFMTRGILFSRRFVRKFWDRPVAGVPRWALLVYTEYERGR
jgi:hypothetical protein